MTGHILFSLDGLDAMLGSDLHRSDICHSKAQLVRLR
jgi:hypothetical protein